MANVTEDSDVGLSDQNHLDLIQTPENKILVRCKFLRCCKLRRVIPTTLRLAVKDPHAHRPSYTQEDAAGWDKAREEAGLVMVDEALRREKVTLVKLEGNVRKLMLNAQERLDSDIWLKWREELDKRRSSVFKMEHNGHKQRLRGLLTRAGKGIPRWLKRPASSVLESSATMLEDSLVASTPVLSGRKESRGAVGEREMVEGRVLVTPVRSRLGSVGEVTVSLGNENCNELVGWVVVIVLISSPCPPPSQVWMEV